MDRDAMIQALIERSRLLEDVQFRVGRRVYEQYVREALQPAERAAAPVPLIPAEGLYALTVPADRKPLLAVTLRFRVLDPAKCQNTQVLSAAWAWEAVTVNGQPAELATVKGWLRLTPPQEGDYVVAARVALKEIRADGGTLALDVPQTVRTIISLDSPDTWELAVDGAATHLRGDAQGGTHGQLAITPRTQLRSSYGPPVVRTERPPRYAVRGEVAWNLDAAMQQVAARLDVAIVGGLTERLDLSVPAAAERVSVTGPDVRETQAAPGRVAVFLRGKIAERTRLSVGYEMPLAKAGTQSLGTLSLSDGHWAGGTLVVTDTAGGSEVLAASMSGVRQMALADIPASARGILAGAPALAYEITSRTWAAEVEVIDLGEFALRESIADLAHYALAFQDDGTIVCRVSYEIRNRTRQFLRLDLPKGSTVLAARVNDESKPVSPVAGAPDAYLVPLVRSMGSVKGLVSFPVDVVLMCRVDALERRGEVSLPLPRIDLPVAYAWCEVYVPKGVTVKRWAGPLKHVEKYSNETAAASLSYGLGMAAEGYVPKARPVPKAAPPPPPEEKPRPEKKPPSPRGKPSGGRGLLGWFGGARATTKAERGAPAEEDLDVPIEDIPISPEPPAKQPSPSQPPANAPAFSGALLGKNYYRAGKDFYEKQDYANASKSLEQAIALNPKSVEADNARRLLANVKLVQGQSTTAPQSKAEKAAGVQVAKEIQVGNKELAQQQLQYVEKGLEAAREGRESEAKAQLSAAESLGRQLLEQGANKQEQEARLRSARVELSKLREQDVEKARALAKEVKSLESEGRYDEALQAAQKLRNSGLGGFAYNGGVATEIQKLAVKSAQQQAIRRQQKQVVQRIDELKQTLAKQKSELSSRSGAVRGKVELPEALDDLVGDMKADEDRSGKEKPADLAKLETHYKRLEQAVAENRRVLDQSRPTVITGAGTYTVPKTPTQRSTKRAGESAQLMPARDLFDRYETERTVEGDEKGDLAKRHVAAGDASFAKDDWKTAAANYRQALSLDPGSAGAKEGIKKSEAMLGVTTARFGDLSADYARQRSVALEVQKTELGKMLATGKKLYEDGRFVEAGEAFKRVSAKAKYLSSSIDVKRVAGEADLYLQKAMARLEGPRPQGETTPQGGQAAGERRRPAIGGRGGVSSRRAPDRDEDKPRELRPTTTTRVKIPAGRGAPEGVEEIPVQPRADVGGALPAAPDTAIAHEARGRVGRGLWGFLGLRRDKDREEPAEVAQGKPETGRLAVVRPPAQEPMRPSEGTLTISGTVALPPGSGARVREALSKKISFDFVETPMQDVLAFVSSLTDVPIVMDPALREEPLSVTLRVSDMRLDSALGWVMKRAGLRYEMRGGALFVSKPKREGGEIDHRLGFDVMNGPISTFEVQDKRRPAWETELRDKLSKPVSFDFVETPLQDALAFLSSGIGVTIVLDSEAVRDSMPSVTLKVNRMRADQALSWIMKLTGFKYVLRDEAVYVSRVARLSEKPVLRMYDVTDLTIDIEKFRDKNNIPGPDYFGTAPDEKPMAPDKIVEEVKKAITPDSWSEEGEKSPYTIQYRNGRIVVIHSPEVQTQIENLLDNFRSARGPQVQLGSQITAQRAKGTGTSLAQEFFASDESEANQLARNQDFVDFVRRNYDWQKGQVVVETNGDGDFNAPAKPKVITEALGERLGLNLGQKVQVNSINLSVLAPAAQGLGIAFTDGANGVRYAQVDEAQLRTLLELDASKEGNARRVAANPNLQETIVGTDARLANGMVGNVRFAAERGNTLDVNGNPIELPHEKYLLIDNGSSLTAIQGNAMQHWTEAANPFPFVSVSQDIDVPRAGQLVKLEKTLVEPTDELVIRAKYRCSGK